MNEVKIISRGRQPDEPEKIKKIVSKEKVVNEPEKIKKIVSKEKVAKFLPGVVAIISIVTYFTVATLLGIGYFADNFLGLLSGLAVIAIYKSITRSQSALLKIAKVILFYTFVFNVAYCYYTDESCPNEPTIITAESPMFYDYVGDYPLMIGKDQVSDWITIGPCHSYNFSHDQIEMLPKDRAPIKVWQIKYLPNDVTTFKIINRSDKPVSLLIKS